MALCPSFYTIFSRMLSNDHTHINIIFVLNDRNLSNNLLIYKSW